MSGFSISSEQVYQHYKELGAAEFRSLIRLYDDHKESIERLSVAAHFEILAAYTEALFEIGEYGRHLAATKEAVELSVMNNIKIHKGKNIFQQLLYRKSQSHFRLMEYAQAEHILKELIKISPSENVYSKALVKVMRKRLPQKVKTTRAISVALFIISAIIICIEIFAVRPFFNTYIPYFEYTRIGIFGLGLLVLIGGDTRNYIQVQLDVRQFRKQVRADKIKKLHERHHRKMLR